jgi:predicted nucleotidyltransferase component of viral defense system
VSRSPKKNLPASVRQRLLNLSRERGEDFNFTLTRYANERLLYRLACSPYRDQFVLKGAALFQVWSESLYRPTRDIDLLGFGDSTAARIESVFRELCVLEVEPDGLRLLEDSVRAEEIRDPQEYGGTRVRLMADLDGAQIALQVDVGFGDAVTPAIEEADLPTLLEFPAPHLKAYPRETVVAEKFEAMVRLGIVNTRMKDFYDVWQLARTFSFDGASLSRAIAATFERRGTPVPATAPVALSLEFVEERASQWSAFLERSHLVGSPDLADVVDLLVRFLLPPASAAAAGEPFPLRWPPGGDWVRPAP